MTRPSVSNSSIVAAMPKNVSWRRSEGSLLAAMLHKRPQRGLPWALSSPAELLDGVGPCVLKQGVCT